MHSPELLIVVFGNALSALIMLAGGLFVLFKNPRRLTNRLFFFLSASTFLYTLFFIIAALQTSYASAYFWWFLNIFDVFIPMAVVHFVLRIAGRDREWKFFILLVYAIGLSIFAVAWLHPAWFLPAVVPKLYFPYYLQGGFWYALMLAYFLFAPLIAAFNLLIVYFSAAGIERKRLEYVLLALLVGYIIGSVNFLLVFNIPVDPVYGMFIGFYLIPIAYGIFSTDLLDIRIVVRRALYFALAIASLAALLATLLFLDTYLARTIPEFQAWTIPLVAALVAVLIFRIVLKQLRETERLKYEFITIATHKLRTPLTHIHWLIPELLQRAGDNRELREGLRQIDNATNRLVELTNVLLEAAHAEHSFPLAKTRVAIRPLVEESLARFQTQISEKKLRVAVEGEATAFADARRIASVVDILLENAVSYTPPGGAIRVALASEGGRATCRVSDTGIGVAPEDRERIWAGLFRTDGAKRADTEGVGLGLSLAKSIIERHDGQIGVDSEGKGKGSTFWFALPSA